MPFTYTCKQHGTTGSSLDQLGECVDCDLDRSFTSQAEAQRELRRRYPSVQQLEEWSSDGGCESLDGCWVEPDGVCEHGKPSWLLHLGLI